jgi:predicted transcriptional regulator
MYRVDLILDGAAGVVAAPFAAFARAGSMADAPDPAALTSTKVCSYHTCMATTVIRTTYALDEDTVRRLESLARQWNVSKSEALRRAIRAADAASVTPDARLSALDELQASMGLTRTRAQAWVREVRSERRRSTARRVARR